MEEKPPIIAFEEAPPAPRRRLGWSVHLVLLTLYPLLVGGISLFAANAEQAPVLPSDPGPLLLLLGMELALFAAIFGLAWWASRATRQQLMLPWRGGIRPLGLGFLYSIGLRLLLMLVVFAITMVVMAITGWDPETTAKMIQPQTEQIVDAQALVASPVYLLMNLTFVSFVVAGFREELWRAGMLAGLAALFPQTFQSRWGQFIAILAVAIVFGMGHLTQGWGGVAMTGVLGLGLGAIMMFHRSIWEAVLAHGFFNASTFAMLYLVARFRPEVLPGG